MLEIANSSPEKLALEGEMRYNCSYHSPCKKATAVRLSNATAANSTHKGDDYVRN